MKNKEKRRSYLFPFLAVAVFSSVQTPTNAVTNDGSLLVTGTLTLDTDVRQGKTYPDAVAYPVSAITQNSATCSTVPAGISADDQVVIINLQGASL